MMTPEEGKFWSYPLEYFEKYAVFDENTDMVVKVKDKAPPDFKKAFEEHKKMCDKARKLGIIL